MLSLAPLPLLVSLPSCAFWGHLPKTLLVLVKHNVLSRLRREIDRMRKGRGLQTKMGLKSRASASGRLGSPTSHPFHKSHTHTQKHAHTYKQACHLFGAVALLPFPLGVGDLQTKWKVQMRR